MLSYEPIPDRGKETPEPVDDTLPEIPERSSAVVAGGTSADVADDEGSAADCGFDVEEAHPQTMSTAANKIKESFAIRFFIIPPRIASFIQKRFC